VKVFLAGAAGVIGRPLVPLLLAAGHEVTGTTRDAGRAAALREAGATPVVVDALDERALRAAVGEASPDAIVHQLTSLPDRFNPRDRGMYSATNRIRAEGTRNLLAAARATGVERVVCQSIALGYEPGAVAEVKDEEAPLALGAPAPFGEGVRVVDQMERAVLEAGGAVLRYGWFYGPGTWFAEDGSMAADVHKRRFPIIGKGAGLFSFVHVDDAASATLTAVEDGARGVYNVVDDEPAAVRDWLPVYAEALGAPPPRRVPVWLARLIAGKIAASADVQPGASNAKIKRELGWEPRWRSWREGFRDAPR
jgi:2-alkyl-3-oxoalkanoate reductase